MSLYSAFRAKLEVSEAEKGLALGRSANPGIHGWLKLSKHRARDAGHVPVLYDCRSGALRVRVRVRVGHGLYVQINCYEIEAR